MAILVFLLAFAIPVYLLYRFGSHSWIWHTLALAAALGLGFLPTPPEWKTKTFDLLFGSVFMFLLVWGIGGLLPVVRHHRARHA
jgi:hypothetical protein